MKRATLLLAACLASCTDEPQGHLPLPRAPVGAPMAFKTPAGLTSLRFGLVPHLSAESIKASRKPLADYLGRQLHLNVELVAGESYDDVGQKLARGEIDFVEFSPYAYVRARTKVKMVPLLTAISEGSGTSGGYIVVRDDSPRKTINDLKGASFAFVDPASTSGYLYPMKLFRDRGIDPARFFSSTTFLGNHEAVLLAVLDGGVEAGATWQGSFQSLRRSNGVEPRSFRVIAKTPRTPQDIYCLREGLPPELGQAIKQLMLGLSVHQRADREVLAPMGVNGFIEVDLTAYDAVAEVAASLDAGF